MKDRKSFHQETIIPYTFCRSFTSTITVNGRGDHRPVGHPWKIKSKMLVRPPYGRIQGQTFSKSRYFDLFYNWNQSSFFMHCCPVSIKLSTSIYRTYYELFCIIFVRGCWLCICPWVLTSYVFVRQYWLCICPWVLIMYLSVGVDYVFVRERWPCICL